jgi:hypothetical protein
MLARKICKFPSDIGIVCYQYAKLVPLPINYDMISFAHDILDFFVINFPSSKALALGGPAGLLWAAACSNSIRATVRIIDLGFWPTEGSRTNKRKSSTRLEPQ